MSFFPCFPVGSLRPSPDENPGAFCVLPVDLKILNPKTDGLKLPPRDLDVFGENSVDLLPRGNLKGKPIPPPPAGGDGLNNELGEGEGEGLGDGLSEGEGLGESDGLGEREGLGDKLGEGLRDGDGEGEGLGDGEGLNNLDGLGDGLSDGEILEGEGDREGELRERGEPKSTTPPKAEEATKLGEAAAEETAKGNLNVVVCEMIPFNVACCVGLNVPIKSWNNWKDCPFWAG